jgi:predicted  nucleic acid-binding Zn-ribbon protein
LATLQADHKEVLQSLKEQEEQVARLERELQDGRQQTAAAEDLLKGLQLENARYGCGRERQSRMEQIA